MSDIRRRTKVAVKSKMKEVINGLKAPAFHISHKDFASLYRPSALSKKRAMVQGNSKERLYEGKSFL
jgi:hypothetical protein